MRFKNNVINSALILYSEAVFRDYMKPGFDFNMLIYKMQTNLVAVSSVQQG